MIQRNLLQNSLSDIENNLMAIKRERVGRDKLGVWDQQIQISVYKNDKQQGPTV